MEKNREQIQDILAQQIEAYTIFAVHGITAELRADALRRRDLTCMMLQSLLSTEVEVIEIEGQEQLDI